MTTTNDINLLKNTVLELVKQVQELKGQPKVHEGVLKLADLIVRQYGWTQYSNNVKVMVDTSSFNFWRDLNYTFVSVKILRTR